MFTIVNLSVEWEEQILLSGSFTEGKAITLSILKNKHGKTFQSPEQTYMLLKNIEDRLRNNGIQPSNCATAAKWMNGSTYISYRYAFGPDGSYIAPETALSMANSMNPDDQENPYQYMVLSRVSPSFFSSPHQDQHIRDSDMTSVEKEIRLQMFGY